MNKVTEIEVVDITMPAKEVTEVVNSAEQVEEKDSIGAKYMTMDDDAEITIDSDWEDALSPSMSTGSVAMFACPFVGCDKFFSKRKRLTTHELTHSGTRPYTCKEEGCTETYTRVSHLKRHVDNVHRKIRFKCSECPLHYYSRDAVAKHERLLHNTSPQGYKCEKCSKVFKKKNQLIGHIASHEGQKPHECTTCGKGFTFPNKLKLHMELHEKKYSCSQCIKGVQFDTWSELRKHMSMIHKPVHKCDVCDAAFKTLSQLKDHAKSHKKEREMFHCSEERCDRVYFHIRNLTHHFNTAHRSKGLPCTYPGCDKKLINKRALDWHQQLHEERGLDVRPPHVKKGAIKPTKVASRKDKGTAKKPMAVLLTSATIEAEGEKRLLKDEEFGLDKKEIESQLNENQALSMELERSDAEDTEAAELCRRKYCNVRPKKKVSG